MWRLTVILLSNIILSTLFFPHASFAAEIIPSKNSTAGTDGFRTSNLEVANKDNLIIAYTSTLHHDSREGAPRSYTEGGSVNVNDSVNKTGNVTSDTVSKINDNLLVSLLNDTHGSAYSSVHARKGVGNGTKSAEENKTRDENEENKTPIVQQKTDSMVPDVSKNVVPVHQENKTSPTEPKKPTVTVGSDDKFIPSHFNVPIVKSSSKPTTIVTENKAVSNSEEPHESESKTQLDSPKEVISVERVGKGYMNPLMDNHPGFILPVVITILVVPMFGLLGYLALRRGREAWKNRHYRRMDFLLDGMYND